MAWQSKVFVTATVATVTASTLLLTNTTSWASGVSLSSQAVTIATTTTDAPRAFDATISNALISLQNSGDTNQTSIQTFYDSYKTAQNNYQTAVTSAGELYNSSYTQDPSGAAAAFVANLTAARDAFVSAVGVAKDRLLTELNGGATTSAGDSFNQSFSEAITQYVISSNGLTSRMKELSR
jgi:hypothetical protein